ncbi:hypothetical protein LTR10_001525 [Elasticomyces elasticus]|nr:hypothetical protein LTR10_001525 [Elasticomyces elasticus]KAK4975029.1 hypothetical protein LTR42_004238 [Elasticomyces elasticus]
MALTSSDGRLRGNQAFEECTAAINKANEVHAEYDKTRSELARLQQSPGGLLNPGLSEEEARQELIDTESRTAHHGATAEQLATENAKVKDVAARVNTTIDNIVVVKPGPSKIRAIQLRRKFWVFLNGTHDIRQPDELEGLENIKLLGMGMGAPSRLEASENFALKELREVMDDRESESWSVEAVFRMARRYRTNAVSYEAQLREMEALRTEKEELSAKAKNIDADVKARRARVQELEKKVGDLEFEREKWIEKSAADRMVHQLRDALTKELAKVRSELAAEKEQELAEAAEKLEGAKKEADGKWNQLHEELVGVRREREAEMEKRDMYKRLYEADNFKLSLTTSDTNEAKSMNERLIKNLEGQLKELSGEKSDLKAELGEVRGKAEAANRAKTDLLQEKSRADISLEWLRKHVTRLEARASVLEEQSKELFNVKSEVIPNLLTALHAVMMRDLNMAVDPDTCKLEAVVSKICKGACAAVPRLHTVSSSALEWTLSFVSTSNEPFSGRGEHIIRTLWVRTCCAFDPDATLQDTELCMVWVANGCQAQPQHLKYVLAAAKMFATNFEGTAEVSRSAIMAMLRIMELAFRMGIARTELEEAWRTFSDSITLLPSDDFVGAGLMIWIGSRMSDDEDHVTLIDVLLRYQRTDGKVQWIEEHGTDDQKRSLTPYGNGVVLIDRKNSFVAVFKDEELSVRHEFMAGITWVMFNGTRRDWEQVCTEVPAFGIRTDLKGDIWIAKHLTGASRRNAEKVFGTSKYRR